MKNPTILVLAGRRHGRLDPLASARSLTHKCVVPVSGNAMIAHVLETIRDTFPEARILVSIEDFSAIADVPIVAELTTSGRLMPVEAQHNLVESVARAAEIATFPLLITTADNVLLTAEAITAMLDTATSADAVVALARKEQIMQAHPAGKNRYYEFSNGGFSNCNLFLLRDRHALRAAEPFREGGQFLKVKGRILKTFGLTSALMFQSGLFSLERMFKQISGRIGVRVKPLVLNDGRLAIDVDDEASLVAVESILARQHAALVPG
ncbi:NTP transferase domain-containing protein [Blastomonas sp.]|uniref:NTP transferase domain-containing protein n=1 Tax=Blastomonas sp. TaxID=1909299 RepID=UPI0035943CBE